MKLFFKQDHPNKSKSITLKIFPSQKITLIRVTLPFQKKKYFNEITLTRARLRFFRRKKKSLKKDHPQKKLDCYFFCSFLMGTSTQTKNSGRSVGWYVYICPSWNGYEPNSAWLWSRVEFSSHSTVHHLLHETQSHGLEVQQPDDVLGAIMTSNF